MNKHKPRKPRRIIIENRSYVSDITALYLVMAVISQGRISNNNKQYCYLTRFDGDVMVATNLNKSSDRFIVYEGPSDE